MLLLKLLSHGLISLNMLFGLWAAPAMADDFLAPEQAFAFSTRIVDGRTVRLHWDIAAGYHLYRDRISVQGDAPSVKLASLILPPGEEKFDSGLNKVMAIYRKSLDIDLHITKGGAAVPVTVGWQGCADEGLCYPPESKRLQIALSGLGASQNLVAQEDSGPDPAAPQTNQESSVADSVAATLASGSLLQTMGVFWLAGLLLAFTPCVLPMVPILSSLIVGQGGLVGRGKGFGLALTYTLGMAFVYSGLGVAAGLAGEGLAASLQNPWVLGTFALLLSFLAMSMFGFYELQMPGVIQSRAAEWSNRFRGGSFVGVFIMGGVSALVVGPCVAAPLAGALVYISKTHDVVLGGLALFSLALGMGVPLLLVGMSAGSLLPRAGRWMERVKQVFGMMLLGVAIWIVAPVLPAAAHMLLWAIWLLAAAALLGLFGAASSKHANPPVMARACGAGLSALAVVLLVGAASGGQSVLQPLAHLRVIPAEASSGATVRTGLQFERVTSIKALDAVLADAQQTGQTVMLDFYADWCVACKELETFTFSKPEIQKCLNATRRIQADVTANSDEDKALLKRFSLFGPPGIVFFDGASAARVTHKVIGYQAPGEFLVSLSSAAIC